MKQRSRTLPLPRLLLTATLVAFVALSPPWIARGLEREVYTAFLERPKPVWKGRVEIWHIAEFRTYQGSVTDYLQARADAFCKRRPGVDIDVVGLTPKRYSDRVNRGAFPDAYSFPSGLLYRERLCAVTPQLPSAFAGTLAPARADGAIYAVPYLMSGYLLCANTALTASLGLTLPPPGDAAALRSLLGAALSGSANSPQLFMPPVLAARMGLVGDFATQEAFFAGKAALAVLDARAFGDLVRGNQHALSLETFPLGGYSEQVLYLGAARDTDANRAAVVADFMAFLLSDDEQRRLTALGALPVTQLATPCVYTEETLDGLALAYAEPVVPEPFAYERHREKLAAEAQSALSGDPAAIASFFERMQVVETGIF